MLAATVVIEAVFADSGAGKPDRPRRHPARFPDRAGVVVRDGDRVITVNLIADLLCAAVDPRIEQ